MSELKDLNMQRIIQIKRPFWEDLAIKIKLWILEDMIAGFCQAYTGASSYLSAKYVKYKNNYMNRFTTRHYKDGTVTNKGTKLKAYSGQSVKSNKTQKVNMYLTGQTIDGLEYKRSTPTSLTMSYKEKDEMKIKGNEDLGRHITTLTDANQDKVLMRIEDELEKNIKEFYRGTIKVTIGK